MLGIIYCYTSPSGKKYIGQTVDKDRLSKHLFLCNKGVDIPFYRAIRKYGIENFKYEVLYSVDSDIDTVKSILNEKEKYYIQQFNTYKNGYNCSLGGEGNLGYKHTKETKNILRNITKKQWKDDSFKEKMISLNKGKVLSEETKEKISSASKNHWKNKEYIEKMKTRNTKKVLCIESGIIYNSVKECSEIMNINKVNISQVCRGERRQAKGFSFEYII